MPKDQEVVKDEAKALEGELSQIKKRLEENRQ